MCHTGCDLCETAHSHASSLLSPFMHIAYPNKWIGTKRCIFDMKSYTIRRLFTISRNMSITSNGDLFEWTFLHIYFSTNHYQFREQRFVI